MFALEGPQTPRPRPPAQLRRSTSKGQALNSEGAPPPPYILEFPSLHHGADYDASDPVVATAKMMGIQLEDEPVLSPTILADVGQKSREELANLFLQAEKIIKARETELSLAANLGKTLLETNEVLKLRHDALLSRLPVMQSQASTLAPASRATAKSKRPQTDPWTTDDDVPTSALHSRTSSIIGSASGSPTHSPTHSLNYTLAYRGHARSISASPAALLALSETNAELISELTILRASTDSAQIDGARRLRKLEREIGGLKAELDASQRTNAELEELVKDQMDEERKRDREERLRKLRLVEDAQDQDSDQEIRDFAPHGQGADAWDSVATPRMARQIPPPISTDVTLDSEPEAPQSAYDASVSSATSSHFGPISSGEYAVVAQLYRKVEELQEANAELGARNAIVHERLARAERDALEIKRVYDEIGEEIGADADGELSDPGDGPKGTLRGLKSPSASFRTLRASRNAGPSSRWAYRSKNRPGLADPVSAETPTNKSRAGTRALGNKQMYKGTRAFKSRKPLTDTLFAPPSTQDDGGSAPSIVLVPSRSPRSRSKPKGKGKGKARPKSLLFRPPSPLDVFEIHQDFSDTSRVSSGIGLESRRASLSSCFSTSSYASLARYAGRRHLRRSLGSELGDEFGADWGGGPPDISRHSTFFDDESLRAGSIEYRDSDIGDEASGRGEEEEEDPALAALRNAFSPPNAGRFLEEDEHILPVGALRSSPGEAFHLVSHAVAMRPNRWLESDDGVTRVPGPRGILMHHPFFTPHSAGAEDPWETTRYPEIEPGEDDRGGVVHARTCRRERALERMASARRASHGEGLFALAHASQVSPADDTSRGRNVVERMKRTSTDALIELWIFLQFVVVICTFLYTMTRRGPREVLGAPPRRA